MDEKAKILETILSSDHGTREIIRELGWSPSRAVNLLRKMKDEGLIASTENKRRDPFVHISRGRPKKIVTYTPLGIEFLETYRRLKMKPLRARREDLERATKDAEYTDRLVASGHSPFELFMELNNIASNIKISSENPKSA